MKPLTVHPNKLTVTVKRVAMLNGGSRTRNKQYTTVTGTFAALF